MNLIMYIASGGGFNVAFKFPHVAESQAEPWEDEVKIIRPTINIFECIDVHIHKSRLSGGKGNSDIVYLSDTSYLYTLLHICGSLSI